MPLPDLIDDSATRIEADRARAVFRLRRELRNYWLSICASELEWQRARPSDLVPMFGRYITKMAVAYARETMPQK